MNSPRPRPSPRSRSLRWIAKGCLFVALGAALSGCVYLRLLKFKQQLKDFDAHVEVVHGERLALALKKPLLFDSDFVFITESRPTRIETLATEPARIENWRWRFEKKIEPEAQSPFALFFVTRFEDSLLTSVEFDPKLTEVIPDAFIVELFRSMGEARINQIRRSATATMSREDLEGVPLPSLAEIEAVMGEPTQLLAKKKRQSWRYTFNFHNPDSGEIAGQFKLIFRSRGEGIDHPITGFEVTGKAR